METLNLSLPLPMNNVTIIGCARCGGRHENIVLRPLARPFAPPEAGGLEWTHWAPCPTNGDPILNMVIVPGDPMVSLPGSTP